MQVSEILQLSVAERMQIVEDIWDSISRNPDELPLSETEKLELDKRVENYKENPAEGIEWETLKKNLSPQSATRSSGSFSLLSGNK